MRSWLAGVAAARPMQVFTAVVALTLGYPLVAHGAAKVPVALYQVDPGTFRFEGTALQEPQTTPGPVLDWSLPAGGGSGHFEVVADVGQLYVVSSGVIISGVLGASQGFDVRLVPETPLKIGMLVPDFGESMTTIAFVKKRLGDEPFGGPELSSDVSVSTRPYFSSSLLTSDMLVNVSTVTSLRRPSSTTPDEFYGGSLVSLPSGDQITFDLSFEARAQCAPGGQSQGGACSISWADTVGFDVLAIAPEPQNRPQTQCFDQADNDGDGSIDLSDSDCTGPDDSSEGHPFNAAGWGCGIGPELAMLLMPLWWLRRRRSGSY